MADHSSGGGLVTGRAAVEVGDDLGHGQRRCAERDADPEQKPVEVGCERAPDAFLRETCAMGAEDVARRAVGDEPAVAADDGDAVDRVDQPVEAVVDDEKSLPLPADDGVQPRCRLRRQMRGRLVGDEEFGLLRKRGGKRDELLFTAGERGGAARAPAWRHARPIERTVDPDGDLAFGQRAVFECEGDFIADRHAAQRLVGVLEKLGD